MDFYDFSRTGMVSFSKYHHIELINSWDDVLGDDWQNKDDEFHYERYKNWYMREFSKLGQVLK